MGADRTTMTAQVQESCTFKIPDMERRARDAVMALENLYGKESTSDEVFGVIKEAVGL
jgi:hypothetical protein